MKIHRALKLPERFAGQERLNRVHTLGKDVLAAAVEFVTHLRNEIIVKHVQHEFVRIPAHGDTLSAAASLSATTLFRIVMALLALDALVPVVLVAAPVPSGVVAVVIARVQLLVIDVAAVLRVVAVVDVVAVVGGGIVAVFSLSCFSWIGIAAVEQQLLLRLGVQGVAPAAVAQLQLRLDIQEATADVMANEYAVRDVLDLVSERRKAKRLAACDLRAFTAPHT